LFDQPHTPLAQLSKEGDFWRVAMVRMGRPIEDVPFSPVHTVEQIAYQRSRIIRAVEPARDNPDCCF